MISKSDILKRIEIRIKLNRNEFELKLNINEFELKLNWKRTEIELEINLNWNQFEMNLNWNIQFWFEIEYEVETVLKMNLKRFIKHVLNWNRRSIYYIYNIMAWIERAALRQFANFDHWLRIDVAGDPTVGFS